MVFAGNSRFPERLRSAELLPLGSRIRRRLVLDYASRDELLACLDHVLAAAGNPSLMTAELKATLADHSAGNYRVLMNLADELLPRPPSASCRASTRRSSSRSSVQPRSPSPRTANGEPGGAHATHCHPHAAGLEPLALLDATLLFVVQVLIAQHPDLLVAHEEPAPRTPGLRAAGRIFEAVRELHAALDTYRAVLPAEQPNAHSGERLDDDIPF